MAIIMRGKSTCLLCGRILATNDQIVGFQAFLKPTHPLWRFSDAAFHAECFEAWPQRQEFEALYKEYQAIWASRPPDLSLVEAEAWVGEAFKNFGN